LILKYQKKAIVSVSGDVQSFNDIVAIIVKDGLKVDVKNHGSIENLQEEITRRTQADPRNFFSYVPLQYILPMLSGKGALQHVSSDKYKNIKPISIAEYVQREFVKK